MRIAGMQKLTLLDYPGLTAATVFTPGCNLRCPFCHNGELIDAADATRACAHGIGCSTACASRAESPCCNRGWTISAALFTNSASP